MFIGLPISAAASGLPRRRARPGSDAPVAPDFAAPPDVLGTGTIGKLLIVSAEVTGTPTPLLSYRWLRDGAPISGAGGPAYAPTDADDLAALCCRVTATNETGSTSAESPRVIARHATPVALGLADRAFGQGSGARSLNAAEGFVGAGLTFALIGPPDIGIDPATGVVTVPTAEPLGPATVTVRATSSGGVAETSFTLAVLAAQPETEDDNVIRFDTNARRFDSTTARFDHGRQNAASTDRFDSKLLRFDMNGIRFDGEQVAPAPPPAIARFDAATLRFDANTLRFDAAAISTGDGENASSHSPQTYHEAA
jgi:hypothetical protein